METEWEVVGLVIVLCLLAICLLAIGILFLLSGYWTGEYVEEVNALGARPMHKAADRVMREAKDG